MAALLRAGIGSKWRLGIDGMGRPALDFALEYFDQLPARPCGEGRLVTGRAFTADASGRPPALLVHGAFHGAWCYGLWLRELDRLGWPAAALDIRGHGGLAQAPDFVRQGVREMIADIRAAGGLIGRPPILCGHSLGALLAGAAAEEMDLAGLVLLAPSPPGQLPGAKALPPVPETGAVAPPNLAAAVEKFFPRLDAETARPLVARLTPESPVLLNDRMELRVPVDRSKIDAPALSVSAGLDDADLHPPGQDEAVGAFYRGPNRHLPNASHCFMCDPDWELGLNAILDWWRNGARP